MQRFHGNGALQRADTKSPTVTHDNDSRAQILRLSCEQADASDHENNSRTEGRMKRKKLKALTSKTKAKTKKLLRIDERESTGEGSDSEDHGPLQNIARDPAFSHNELYKQKRWHDRGTAYRPLGALESIATTVVHPKRAIKSKVTRTTAGQLSKAERPFISKKADLEFLEAHDRLSHAESSRPSRQVTSDSEIDDVTTGYREKIKEMKEHRESLRAAWTTSRHVQRVRVVPKRHMEYPDRKFFTRQDSEGEHFDWLSWLGYVRLPKIPRRFLELSHCQLTST